MSAIIRAAVIVNWPKFTQDKEGHVPVMYLDKFGYVTTGDGNLINDRNSVLQLPWKREDGSFASPDEVIEEWTRLRANPSIMFGGKSVHISELAWTRYRYMCKLHLTDDDVAELVAKKRSEFANYLKAHYFPMWDTFCADAQMFMLSIAWAVGEGWPGIFRNLTNEILKGNWGTYDASVPYKDFPKGATGAVACAQIRDGLKTETKADDNPGVVPRNKQDFLLLHNAGVVQKLNLDPDVLYWPNQLDVKGKAKPAKFSDDSTLRAEATVAAQASLDVLMDAAKKEGMADDEDDGTKKR